MNYDYRKLLNLKRRRKLYLTSQDFLNDCAAYFEWCATNAIQEEELFHNKGAIVRADKAKLRVFTKKGLCAFVGIPEGRLTTYTQQGDEWAEAVELVESIIYTQKFENAAAGLINSTLISRDLGLADRQELTGADGGPVQTEEVSPRERIASRLAQLASRSSENGDSGGDE